MIKRVFRVIMRFFRVIMTLALAAVAVVLAVALWHHFMVDPWTRDGRVRAEVVRIAPEVGGTISDVRVVDNQFVHKGDVLFVIDPERFRLALAQVQAAVDSRAQDRRVAQAKAQRRAALSDLVASTEEKEQYSGSASVAAAAVSEAQAQLDLAKLNLARTTIRSPVNGYVTNLNLRVGDYATVGQAAVAVVDSDSFWVAGYFEETKLGALHVGDGAAIEMMSDPRPLAGHIESLSHGIADQNGDATTSGLASVNPVFTWVRLAQRLPVRIHIDSVPEGLTLTAGMTCTVVIGNRSRFIDDVRFAYRALSAGLF